MNDESPQVVNTEINEKLRTAIQDGVEKRVVDKLTDPDSFRSIQVEVNGRVESMLSQSELGYTPESDAVKKITPEFVASVHALQEEVIKQLYDVEVDGALIFSVVDRHGFLKAPDVMDLVKKYEEYRARWGSPQKGMFEWGKNAFVVPTFDSNFNFTGMYEVVLMATLEEKVKLRVNKKLINNFDSYQDRSIEYATFLWDELEKNPELSKWWKVTPEEITPEWVARQEAIREASILHFYGIDVGDAKSGPIFVSDRGFKNSGFFRGEDKKALIEQYREYEKSNPPKDRTSEIGKTVFVIPIYDENLYPTGRYEVVKAVTKENS